MNIENKAILITGANRSQIKQSRFATEEVNDVSILLGNHGISRCRRGLYRRAGSVGRESISEEPGSSKKGQSKLLKRFENELVSRRVGNIVAIGTDEVDSVAECSAGYCRIFEADHRVHASRVAKNLCTIGKVSL
jgi:hypothetical protein